MKPTIVKQSYRAALAGVILIAAAWGQQDPGQTPPAPTPAPAFGQEPPPAQITIAPPVTSLDQASLEPAVAVRSFLQPGVHLTESVNSNLGSGGTVGITRILGSLDLTRIWSRYAFLADYVGGASLYSDNFGSPSQGHAMAAAQRYSWRTGQLQVRDSLTYLPEGSFGFSGFNGAGGGGLEGSGGGTFGSGFSSGSLGQLPRLTNAATLDIRESLNPRSSITAAGGYTFTTFTDSNSQTPGTANSRQVSAQIGYSRVLNRFDQIGLQYGFEEFQFPQSNAGSINAHIVEGIYEHMVSGRMDVILGAGPQYLTLTVPGNGTANPTHQLTVAARGVLRYRMPRQSISLAYNRHTTAGSGIHYGSETDDIRATLSRPLSRLWTSSVDVGYAHNQALLTATPTTKGNAINGSYQSGFAGGGLTRRLGRYFSLQMHYQYTYELFNHNTVNGGNSLNRNIGDITLSWHPAPIRLD